MPKFLSEMKEISFNDVPKTLALILNKVEQLETLLQNNQSTEPSDRWFNLQELCDYLPDRPAKQTVYGWIGQHAVPYHKKGKKLQFLKSEIDAWLKSDKRKTAAELHAEAVQFVNSKKGGAL